MPFWTIPELNLVRKMIAGRHSTREIADATGRTVNAIGQVVYTYKLGKLQSKGLTEKQQLQIVEMWPHEIVKTIARKMRRSVPSIHDWARKLGLPHKRKMKERAR